ncbi:MAG: DUF6496 domain-containing protein [Betaproteobacteria bacterium]
MTVGKVNDFNFSSAGKTVGYCGGGMAKGYAKGGKVMEKSTGETYPSRRAMEKHESMETPRMQRKEVIQRETVKAPSAPREMIKSRGALGVLANKNPGETAMHTAPNLPGKMMLKKGGPVIPKAGYKKIDKVMGEFKAGDLHSGSKTGPKVTGTKQAVAIALSEARRADKKAK